MNAKKQLRIVIIRNVPACFRTVASVLSIRATSSGPPILLISCTIERVNDSLHYPPSQRGSIPMFFPIIHFPLGGGLPRVVVSFGGGGGGLGTGFGCGLGCCCR